MVSALPMHFQKKIINKKNNAYPTGLNYFFVIFFFTIFKLTTIPLSGLLLSVL